MKLWREKELYKHFNPTWEEFCTEHFPQPMIWIDHVITGVKLLDTNPTPVQLSAVIESADRAKRLALKADPLMERKQGKRTDLKQEEHRDNDNDVKTSNKRGTDPQYLTQRIAESSPETHEAMKRGEFPSVRAAAVAAGVVKDKKTITLSPNPALELNPSHIVCLSAILGHQNYMNNCR